MCDFHYPPPGLSSPTFSLLLPFCIGLLRYVRNITRLLGNLLRRGGRDSRAVWLYCAHTAEGQCKKEEEAKRWETKGQAVGSGSRTFMAKQIPQIARQVGEETVQLPRYASFSLRHYLLEKM